MRTVKKRLSPRALDEWRTPRLTKRRTEGMKCTYEELRRDPRALGAVEDALMREQGEICAYTGHRIGLSGDGARDRDFHLEHLLPQEHCAEGQDTEYGNLVACWPRPNVPFEPRYGARKKGNWPPPGETLLFVSPLDPRCTERFTFNRRGEISPVDPDDVAARTTIERLGLNDSGLTALRESAMQGALRRGKRRLTLGEAQHLLRELDKDSANLDRGQPVKLRPFCFAIVRAVEREIRRLEGFAKQK